MAVVPLALTTMTPNGAVLNQAGTTIDANAVTFGADITLVTTAVPAVGNIDRMILYVQNTLAAPATVTVRAGANTTGDPNSPAFEHGKGDLVTGNLNANTGTAFIGPFEVARFMGPTGVVHVDFSAGMTGAIWAIMLPRAF